MSDYRIQEAEIVDDINLYSEFPLRDMLAIGKILYTVLRRIEDKLDQPLIQVTREPMTAQQIFDAYDKVLGHKSCFVPGYGELGPSDVKIGFDKGIAPREEGIE